MNRPLNPNGEIPLYGNIPKFEIPPFAVAGLVLPFAHLTSA